MQKQKLKTLSATNIPSKRPRKNTTCVTLAFPILPVPLLPGPPSVSYYICCDLYCNIYYARIGARVCMFYDMLKLSLSDSPSCSLVLSSFSHSFPLSLVPLSSISEHSLKKKRNCGFFFKTGKYFFFCRSAWSSFRFIRCNKLKKILLDKTLHAVLEYISLSESSGNSRHKV